MNSRDAWKMIAVNYVRAFRDNVMREGFSTDELARWAIQRGVSVPSHASWWREILYQEGMSDFYTGLWQIPGKRCNGCARRGRWIARQLRRFADWLERR